jgi:hypothetical protein
MAAEISECECVLVSGILTSFRRWTMAEELVLDGVTPCGWLPRQRIAVVHRSFGNCPNVTLDSSGQDVPRAARQSLPITFEAPLVI